MPFQKKNKLALGIKRSQEFKDNLRDKLSGNKNYNWKGDAVGYPGIHHWIRKFKKTNCEYCGSKENLDWANKEHTYKRKKEDWMCLCRSCHKKYDYVRGFIQKHTGQTPWNKGLKGKEYRKHYRNGIGRKKKEGPGLILAAVKVDDEGYVEKWINLPTKREMIANGLETKG